MISNPIPNFQDLYQYQSLSTKKLRKNYFGDHLIPPKAPVRSCPVSRIKRPIFKEESPKPVSFRENADSSFISESSLYSMNKRDTYFEQCFVLENVLGKGCFGEVYKVRNRETGFSFACKRTLLKYRSEIDRVRRLEEVKKHELLPPHINCVRFYRAWEEHNHLYLLTEVCQKSLADILEEVHEFAEETMWSYLVDILQGLHHLHMNKFIHMDIKPENIFIGSDNLCKIGDFGLVIDFSKGYPHDAVEGDPRYLAPECFRNIYTPAADVFSLGIVMLELATDLYLPKEGPLWQQLRSAVIPPLEGLSHGFREIVHNLLLPEYEARLTTSRALQASKIRRVIKKKQMQRFIKTKVHFIRKCVSALLTFPLLVCSFVLSLSLKLFTFTTENKRLFPKFLLPAFTGNYLNSTDTVDGVETHPSLDDFSLLPPIINSTPISCVKRTHSKSVAQSDPCFSSDEDEFISISRRFCGGDSSLSSLELSCEGEKGSSSSNPPQPPLKQAAQNLMDLFNSVDGQEE